MKLTELNDLDFAKEVRKAHKMEGSEFFQFTQALKGYDLYLRETPVDKWEVCGVWPLEDILNQKTPIIYKKR